MLVCTLCQVHDIFLLVQFRAATIIFKYRLTMSVSLKDQSDGREILCEVSQVHMLKAACCLIKYFKLCFNDYLAFKLGAPSLTESLFSCIDKEINVDLLWVTRRVRSKGVIFFAGQGLNECRRLLKNTFCVQDICLKSFDGFGVGG